MWGVSAPGATASLGHAGSTFASKAHSLSPSLLSLSSSITAPATQLGRAAGPPSPVRSAPSGSSWRARTRADHAALPMPDSAAAASASAAMPRYFNFATRDAFLNRGGGLGSPGRRHRPRSIGPAEEEQLLLYSARQREEPGLPPFRREIAAVGGSSRMVASLPVSVDVTAKRFVDMFCDYEMKRCKLCNEPFVQWHLHCSGIPHSGREGMLYELLRPFAGTPEELVRRWSQQLVTCTDFGHIPSLSHADAHVRKRRLQHLLHYLTDVGVLQEVFNLGSDANTGASRGFQFERLEFIGDGVVKYVLANIIGLIFPASTGGTRGRLSYFQFVMDGNEGLARGYDYLELQDFTKSSRVVSKFKSDVVETLFGEMQFYLWATQLDVGTSPLPHPFTKEMYTLRALVEHTMYELAIVLFMYHVEYILGMLQRVVREEQLQYIRADPSLLQMQSRGNEAQRSTMSHYGGSGGGGEDDDDIYGGSRRGAGGGLSIPAPTVTLMKTRVARSHLLGSGAATFLESTNYDNFKRVVPIGGLLPRAFSREELAVIPNYMPHVQRDVGLTLRMRGYAATSWAQQLDKELVEGECEEGSSSLSIPPRVGRDAAYTLSATSVVRDAPAPAALSVPRLKDEELIAELI